MSMPPKSGRCIVERAFGFVASALAEVGQFVNARLEFETA